MTFDVYIYGVEIFPVLCEEGCQFFPFDFRQLDGAHSGMRHYRTVCSTPLLAVGIVSPFLFICCIGLASISLVASILFFYQQASW